MNITVYLPDDIGRRAKDAGLNLSALLRGAVAEELEFRQARAALTDKATEHELEVEDAGGTYVVTFAGTEVGEEDDVTIYLHEDGRVIAHDAGKLDYEEVPDVEALGRLVDHQGAYVVIARALGWTPRVPI